MQVTPDEQTATTTTDQEVKKAEEVPLVVQLSLSILSLEEVSSEQEIIQSIIDLFAGKSIEEILAHGFPTAQFDNLVATKRRLYTNDDRAATVNLVRSVNVLPPVRKPVRKKGVKLV